MSDPISTACFLKVSLPTSSTVRSVLLSAKDLSPIVGIGLIVSVGETLATSTRCYFTNYNKTTTSSPTGLSAWLTCDDLVGSNLFVSNPTYARIMVYEVMAFSQYNLISIATIYSIYSTPATSGSKQKNLLKTEMNIETGTSLTCYTSVTDPAPYISIKLDAAIGI
jgi:hypothetical protein